MSTYTLYHGDCLDVLPTLEAQSVDAVICDPPYGTTACKWDSVIPFAPMWAEIKRVLRPCGACVLFGSQPFTSALVMSNPRWFKYEWVWAKNRPTGSQQAKNRPMGKHENILVFSAAPMGHASLLGNARMRYNPQGVRNSVLKVVREKGFHSRIVGPRPNQVGREYISQTGFPDTLLSFDKEEDHTHPTQKPLALLEYLVKTYTDAGDTVLDFTMGSGTTGHACMNLGRRFIGIERDAGYYAIAERRIADAADPLRHMAGEAA